MRQRLAGTVERISTERANPERLHATVAPVYRAIADSIAIRLSQTRTGGDVSYFKTDAEARSFVMGPNGDAGL